MTPYRPPWLAALRLALATTVPAGAWAQAATPAATLPPVQVSGHYDNAVGTSDAASEGTIRAELLRSRPALRPGEVLEFVPGVIVTQHSGDGKANQYFLRGFNLDHGTDFATTVNGLPVNMPSHAHGQGYSDLNFLIPELVERIDYRKGPYFARQGDFASAGSADIVYRRAFDAPFGEVSVGARGFRRGVLGASAEVAPGVVLLGALEGLVNDGPWSVPEDLRKANGVLTLSSGSAAAGWSVSAMGYGARWTATDQIPQRLIDAGTFNGRPFGRFDSLDPTAGGRSERHSLSGQWHSTGDDSRTEVSAFAMRYSLGLFSNFTYALERPAQGDQFSQQDRRTVVGVAARHAFGHALGPWGARSELGAQLRHDRAQVGLFDTVARVTAATTREDAIRQTLASVYGQTGWAFSPALRAVAGLRADRMSARVDALSNPVNGGRSGATQLSPKLTLVAGPFEAVPRTEFFVNAGRGFHSNDARGTTARVDPRTGDPVDAVPPLVASRGAEVGVRTEALPGLQSSLALWRLNFDSELVYVGDAGATEAHRASRRVGVEWNNRWTPTRWFLLDADLAWTRARFAAGDPSGDRIPNSVDTVASIAATVRDRGPWSASLQWRYLGPGPLIEDDSVRSRPTSTANLRVGYRINPKADLTLDVFNLLDRRVDDIQYFYESRLPGEAGPVADRHVHPAEPRTVRASLRLAF
jgi:outer membrane receptor protein involved in Fe transport